MTCKYYKPPSPIIRNVQATATTISAGSSGRVEAEVPTVSGYTPVGIIGLANVGPNSIMTNYYNASTNKVLADLYNHTSSPFEATPIFIVLYSPN